MAKGNVMSTSTRWGGRIVPSKHPLKVGMHATRGKLRGIVIETGFTATTWKGRSIQSPTVALSTSEGLLVDIPVRDLN